MYCYEINKPNFLTSETSVGKLRHSAKLFSLLSIEGAHNESKKETKDEDGSFASSVQVSQSFSSKFHH